MPLTRNQVLWLFVTIIASQSFVYMMVVLGSRAIERGITRSQEDLKKESVADIRKMNTHRKIRTQLRKNGLIALMHEKLINLNWYEFRDILDQNVLNNTVFDVIIRMPNQSSPFVILTATNSEFVDITENFFESLRRLRLRYNITLMAEDDKTYDYFNQRANSEFHVVSSKQFKLPGKLASNISSYQHLIRRRTVYIYTLLRSGRDVLLVDVDAVWLRDPVALILDEYYKYDVWIAQGKEENFPCPCFFYMKAIPKVINLVYDWIGKVSFYEGAPLTDQNALALLLEKNKRNVKFRYLDYERFPLGGKMYFNWTWHKEHAHKTYVAHGNHLGREQGKRDTFKEFGVWYMANT